VPGATVYLDMGDDEKKEINYHQNPYEEDSFSDEDDEKMYRFMLVQKQRQSRLEDIAYLTYLNDVKKYKQLD
jgi:hypothetical protein